ncbi:MAG: indolepyruvate ferredoxin oxidoreductase subunit alpha [Tannerella sp.]|jgi:indolepyruvate ferredoxin oxidoreductase alpha subunit|nr:indolepyruvate ferredoxin oxidoreductase subunit alpha [Tannerella sp.]
MERQLLLGDEAIAQAAIDAGLSGVYSYPGTPSTEITEYIQHSPAAREGGIRSRWCTNEKTAMEAALGMSYAGKRALCCMKHVGLNVAADCFINAAMTGIHGGMIVVTADDPSMHSSQNEQDNRFYGQFAMLPVLEPSSQQEAYDMVYEGFELSERLGYPVLLRITTRLAHSRAGVTVRPARPQNALQCPADGRQRYILLPVNARRRYRDLLAAQERMTEASEAAACNRYFDAPDRRTGIITTGLAFNYLSENCPGGFVHPVLKICQYPLPVRLIRRLAGACDTILVLEEGAPFVEAQLKGLLGDGPKVKGRLDGTLARDGELTPDAVGRALGLSVDTYYAVPDVVEKRPPALCRGCGHRDLFDALNEVVGEYDGAKVFSDIGCYALGALPPLHAIDSCVDMGASITMAKGAADAGVHPSVAVIGDSTFTHSGMTGLLDCVNENSPVTVVISDNETTAMTGGQDSAGTGRLEAICEGLGVAREHIRVFTPLARHFDAMKAIVREEIEYRGISVLIPRRECVQTLSRKNKEKDKTKVK